MVSIVFDIAFLVHHFEFSYTRHEVNFGVDYVHSDRDFQFNNVFRQLGVRLNIYAHMLCLLAYLLSFNVMPRASSLNEIWNSNIYLLYKLVLDETE